MRDLVFPDRHDLSVDDHDVDGLQERIPEQAEVRHVAFGHVPEPLLVRRHTLQPSERSDHPEEQRELRHLRELRLPVQDRPFGIDPGSEQIQHEPLDERGQLVDPVVVRSQHVPVGHEVEALVALVLQADGVAHVPGPVSDVQGSGRTEPGEDARSFGDCAHDGGDDSAGPDRAREPTVRNRRVRTARRAGNARPSPNRTGRRSGSSGVRRRVS